MLIMVETATCKPIVPAEFPKLAMLAWNRNPARPIPPEEALAL